MDMYIKDLFSTRETESQEVGDRTTPEKLGYLWHVALSNIPLIIVRRVLVTSNLYSVRSGLITFNLPDLPCRRKHATIRKHFYHAENLLSKSSRDPDKFPRNSFLIVSRRPAVGGTFRIHRRARRKSKGENEI